MWRKEKDSKELQRELDDERYARERAESLLREKEENSVRERERQRREWKEESHWNYRQADNWPEALSKQEGLFHASIDDGEETYFSDGAKACARALELWHQVEATRNSEIETLKARLDAIQVEIKTSVASLLREEGSSQGWVQVASALEDDDMTPTEWLQW